LKVRLAGVAVLIAIAVTSAASAGPLAGKQRVSITAAKSGGTKFLLTPLTSGVLKKDAGGTTWQRRSERFVTRDGQRIDVWTGLGTFVGKRGDLVTRFVIEWLDAGNGVDTGSGRWTIIRGTGEYAGLAGGGRSAHSWPSRGLITFRADGLVAPK
jgi:hypothetical protein